MQFTAKLHQGTTESEVHYFLICPKHNNERRLLFENVLLDFSFTVTAAPHECVIRTSQP